MQKRVFITGVGSGIGLATAARLIERGYSVAGTTRNPEKTRGAWRSSDKGTPTEAARVLLENERFQLLGLDLSDPGSIEPVYRQAEEHLGGIDILINNAGRGELGAVEDTGLERAREMMQINYWGPVALCKLALPAMRERGQGILVNLGSIVHELQFPFKAQYCASKSALTGFTLSLRQEVYPYGIRVHLLEPGWVRSEFHERLEPVFTPGGPYESRLKPFQDYSRDQNPKIPDGGEVARILVETIEDPKARVRIPVGSEARKLFLAKHFLTHGMIDRILRWKLSRKETF